MSPGDEGDALASVFAWAQHHLDQDLAIDRLASARPFSLSGVRAHGSGRRSLIGHQAAGASASQ